MLDLCDTPLPGCYEIQPQIFKDARGRFVKVFHKNKFKELGLEVEFAEEYYTRSKHGVVRGMHFQIPPADHVKLVYCLRGKVFDVVVDLRLGSPTYGKAASFELSAKKGNSLYIPKGMAHGFCSISDDATLVYKVSSMYFPACDAGILWNSINTDWPIQAPIISERDLNFVPLADFNSPFIYD